MATVLLPNELLKFCSLLEAPPEILGQIAYVSCR